MSKDNKVQQEQIQQLNESAEFQNNVLREFIEDKTGDPGTRGSVDESTARVSDDQNRLITKRNMRK
ncbi:hypothetical protein [Paenibacillus sp. GCM10012306]|uniref:hypothetical protein n=1 Tax=Paenibacillus sp. GCM10012306 TaxID=3317342 RepID=UPI00361B8131